MLPLNKSLKSRLILWVFLPTLLISAIDLYFTYRATGHIATLVQEQLLKGSARIIAEQLVAQEDGYEISIPPAAFELFANQYQDHVFYSVRSKSGQLIAGDEELGNQAPTLGVEQERYFLATVRGEPVRVIAYAHAIPSANPSEFAVTQVAQTLQGHHAFREQLFFLAIREKFILVVIVTVGLFIAFGWTLSPLIRFGESLSRRQPGLLEQVDENQAPSELRPVIAALNNYVFRLNQTLVSYETFVANTAHQLRTSFAIITSQINFGMRQPEMDAQQKDLLQAIQKTVVRSTKVINQMLILAAVEQNRQTQQSFVAVGFAEIIQTAMEELAPLAHQKNIDLGIDVLDEHILIQGSATLLRELVFNLIDNAIEHMQAAGSVTVNLLSDNGDSVLQVEDTGPGIPEAEREKVFERFYRLNPAKPNSSGLGLAIVREICEVLGAAIALKTPAGGQGLLVEVRFPAAQN